MAKESELREALDSICGIVSEPPSSFAHAQELLQQIANLAENGRDAALASGGETSAPALELRHLAEEIHVEGQLRCAICKWPLAKSADKGCVRGNCSERGGAEDAHARRQENRTKVEAIVGILQKWLPQFALAAKPREARALGGFDARANLLTWANEIDAEISAVHDLLLSNANGFRWGVRYAIDCIDRERRAASNPSAQEGLGKLREALIECMNAGSELRYSEYGNTEFPPDHIAAIWDKAERNAGEALAATPPAREADAPAPPSPRQTTI